MRSSATVVLEKSSGAYHGYQAGRRITRFSCRLVSDEEAEEWFPGFETKKPYLRVTKALA